MKKLILTILCISILIFSLGCNTTQDSKKDSDDNMPEEDIVDEPSTPVEAEPVEPVEPETKSVEIAITAERMMVPDEVTINAGDTVIFINKEERPVNHNVIILPGDLPSPSNKDIIAQSDNFGPGKSWEYTFVEKGKYMARDIYTGTARAEITANAVLEESQSYGMINVK